ncbi:MAG: hypothetical protein ACKVZJ_00570 [Phycisphaerales bacterium]
MNQPNAVSVQNDPRRVRFGYRDGVLTVIAALLAMHLLKSENGAVAPEAAYAQRLAPEAYGVPNAAEQRNRMIKVMEEMTAKVQALSSTVERGGFKVEVTAMPKVELVQ